MADAIAAVRSAYARVAAGQVQQPLRAHLEVEDGPGVTLVMSACVPGVGVGTKVVSVFPSARPAIQGLALLVDPATGAPRALVDGTALTAWRTGAATGASVQLLARADATTALVVGAGAQARTQVLALDAARPLERILVHARRPAAVAELVQELHNEVSARLEPAPDLRAALALADVVATATPATAPLFARADLRPGTHLSCVGSFTPAMVELDVDTVAAARVFVDQRAAAELEAGELIAARDTGRSDPATWTELGRVELGEDPGRRDAEELTLFKSVGLAAQDVAVAAAAVAALEHGGRYVEL